MKKVMSCLLMSCILLVSSKSYVLAQSGDTGVSTEVQVSSSASNGSRYTSLPSKYDNYSFGVESREGAECYSRKVYSNYSFRNVKAAKFTIENTGSKPLKIEFCRFTVYGHKVEQSTTLQPGKSISGQIGNLELTSCYYFSFEGSRYNATLCA